MRFVIDAQLPPQLAKWFQARGHLAEHVMDALDPAASDRLICQHSLALDAVLVTKDADFLDLRIDGQRPRLLWVRTGNALNRTLLAQLEIAWPRIEAELASGALTCELP